MASLAGVPSSVTDRAKTILKSVENGDLTLSYDFDEDYEEQKTESEVERILKELDLNNMSPMQAFLVLSDLKDKVK